MKKDYKIKESTLNKQVIKWLNSLPACFAYKRYGHMSNKGKPDISGCINGIRIELEGKVGSNKPTPNQAHWLAKWKSAGAISGWFTSLEQAQDIVTIQYYIKTGNKV